MPLEEKECTPEEKSSVVPSDPSPEEPPEAPKDNSQPTRKAPAKPKNIVKPKPKSSAPRQSPRPSPLAIPPRPSFIGSLLGEILGPFASPTKPSSSSANPPSLNTAQGDMQNEYTRGGILPHSSASVQANTTASALSPLQQAARFLPTKATQIPIASSIVPTQPHSSTLLPNTSLTSSFESQPPSVSIEAAWKALKDPNPRKRAWEKGYNGNADSK